MVVFIFVGSPWGCLDVEGWSQRRCDSIGGLLRASRLPPLGHGAPRNFGQPVQRSLRLHLRQEEIGRRLGQRHLQAGKKYNSPNTISHFSLPNLNITLRVIYIPLHCKNWTTWVKMRVFLCFRLSRLYKNATLPEWFTETLKMKTFWSMWGPTRPNLLTSARGPGYMRIHTLTLKVSSNCYHDC